MYKPHIIISMNKKKKNVIEVNRTQSFIILVYHKPVGSDWELLSDTIIIIE